MPEQKLNGCVILKGRHTFTMKYSHQTLRTVLKRARACGACICCFDSTAYQQNYNFPQKRLLNFYSTVFSVL